MNKIAAIVAAVMMAFAPLAASALNYQEVLQSYYNVKAKIPDLQILTIDGAPARQFLKNLLGQDLQVDPVERVVVIDSPQATQSTVAIFIHDEVVYYNNFPSALVERATDGIVDGS